MEEAQWGQMLSWWVCVCGGLRDTHVDKKGSLGRKRWWRQRSYVTPPGSALNFPTCLPTARPAWATRDWENRQRAGEGRWRRKGKFCDILIRESRERAGDLETLNSSCLLKSRTLFFIFYSVPQPLVHLFFFSPFSWCSFFSLFNSWLPS